MIVSIPLNTLIARLLKKQQEQQMKNRDKRTRLMSDLLNNIRRSVFVPTEVDNTSAHTLLVQHQALRLGERLHSVDFYCAQ